MAAKLLHSLTDDNPDLQKQIGCMTGVFQLFDRHQVLSGRRITGPSPKRHPSVMHAGTSHNSSGTSETESSNKNPVERQRASIESSRASFSSSSRSSSFSSLDCVKASQPDQKISPETLTQDLSMATQSNASPQYGCHSLDLRDVVKDSMYRESRALSVKTTTKESSDRSTNHRDSPRPTKLIDGGYGPGPNGKQNGPTDLNESIKVLNKLKESPWYLDEPRELLRSASYNMRSAPSFMVQKDAPRFSYDGREVNRLSVEPRDMSKQVLKHKELPRLSLDNRDSSLQSLNSDTKYNLIPSSKPEAPVPQKTQARPPSVVAKLMGLETLPASTLANESRVEDSDHYSKQTIQISNSSKNLWKEPTSPRWRNNDPSMKSISRFPIEPAPWRQLDLNRSSQKSVSRPLKSPAKPASPFPSVYCEIEKRLSDLEFTRSGKDLRALKQILEAMQEKGLLEGRRLEGEDSNLAIQKEQDKSTSAVQHGRLLTQRKQQVEHVLSSTNRGTSSSRNAESSIVIMKPAKLVEKSAVHASVKDQILPKTSRRENSNGSSDTRTNGRSLKTGQTSTRPQHLSKESTKTSSSTSPRLLQKKIELEKRSRPPTPPLDSSRSRRQPNKQQTESTSPGGRRRPKSSNIQKIEAQRSEISSESRNLVISQQLDIEVTSMDRSGEINGCRSPSIEATEYSVSGPKPTPILSEDESLVDLATIAPEYRSPVSVLDKVAYIDNSPSPMKQITETLKDDSKWDRSIHISNTLGSNLTSEMNRQKLQNIEHLVQKLRRLNSGHDEARTDYIASLCENTNPDHRYISEILLASGLLLRDLGSSLTTFQFHQSGHPINPELFLVLEQTKASSKPKEHLSTEKEKLHRKLIFDATNEILGVKLSCVGPGAETCLRPSKITRKTLNAQKLLRELCSDIDQFNAKQPECDAENEDDDDHDHDGLKSILWEDVMKRAENWTDYDGEKSGVVLDVERSIFKDLVGEIVMGESAVVGLQVNKLQGRRRQLFVK